MVNDQLEVKRNIGQGPAKQVAPPSNVIPFPHPIPAGAHRSNDAIVWGEIDEEILDREIEIAYASTIDSKRWRNAKTTVFDFLVKMSRHEERRDKDGLSFVQGKLSGERRHQSSIASLDLMVIDIDVGQDVAELRENIMKLGYFAIIATSHNHMTTESEVKRDKIVELIPPGEDREPTVEDVCAFLRDVKKVRPQILEGAKLIDAKRHKDGILMAVEHAPLPKMRIVLLLSKPFVIADKIIGRKKLRDVIEEWRRKYGAVCDLVGASYDHTCMDLGRGFYFPSHKPNRADWRIDVLPGKMLNLDEITVEAVDPFATASRAMHVGDPNDGKDPQGKLFFKRYGERFNVSAFFEELDPDGHIENRSRGGRTHACPFSDEHTQPEPGQKDMGFYCVDALDSENETAVVHCSHSSCQKRDRIDFVKALLDREGRTWADLGPWVEGIVDEPDFDPAPFGWTDGAGSGSDTKDGVVFPPGYTNTKNGFLCYLEKTDQGVRHHKLCGAIEVLGKSRDEQSYQWGLLIQFRDRDGNRRKMNLPFADVLSDPGETVAMLANAGLWVDGDKRNKGHLFTCLSRIEAEKTVVCATKADWYGDTFLTPLGQVVGANPGTLTLADSARLDSPEARGTLEGWKDNARELLAVCDFHAAVTLGAAFAGPLLTLAGGDSCGLALTGPSSLGKTLSAKAATAIWTDPSPKRGLLVTALATVNALESRMVQANGTTLFVDELKLLPPEEIGKLIMSIASGATKDRANTDGSLRAPRQFTTYFWLSAEQGIREAIEGARKDYVTGYGVRCVDIDVSGSKPHGDLGRVQRLEAGVADHYGLAGVAFVEHVMRSTPYAEDRGKLLEALGTVRDWFLGSGIKDGPRGRAARVLAYALVAAEIAQEAGLLPPGDYLRKAFRRAWDASIGDDEAELVNGPDQAIAKLQGKVLDLWPVHGWDEETDGGGDNPKRMNREKWFYAGLSYTDLDRRERYVVVRTDALDKLIDPGVKKRAVLARLRELGWLLPRGVKNVHSRLPGGESANHYRLSAQHFGPGSGFGLPEG